MIPKLAPKSVVDVLTKIVGKQIKLRYIESERSLQLMVPILQSVLILLGKKWNVNFDARNCTRNKLTK